MHALAELAESVPLEKLLDKHLLEIALVPLLGLGMKPSFDGELVVGVPEESGSCGF